ncbi:XdhC family protein [Priestia koreensis]|uniref:XdhC family protein n=1 Tax=Priestia koreensis TaxID=284581 RepID=UPI003D03DAE2
MSVLKEMFEKWDADLPVTLATIIETKGSTYRKTGAQIIIDSTGKRSGQLSGGCIEQDIEENAKELRESIENYKVLQYLNLTKPDEIWGFDKGCRGDMHILLEKSNWLKQRRSILEKNLMENNTIFYFIVLSHPRNPDLNGKRLLTVNHLVESYDEGLESVIDWIGKVKEQDLQSGLLFDPITQMTIYCHKFEKTSPLIIIGSGDDVLPVIELSQKLKWEVHLGDFRENNIRNISNEYKISSENIGRNIDSMENFIKKYPNTTPIIIMSHNLDFDALALKSALLNNQEYIGVLGPRHRLNNLLAKINMSYRPAIRNPIGVPINADTPEEIAISIVGEIIAFNSKQKNKMIKVEKK